LRIVRFPCGCPHITTYIRMETNRRKIMEEKKILMNDVELNNISGGRDTNKTERENHDKVRYLSS